MTTVKCTNYMFLCAIIFDITASNLRTQVFLWQLISINTQKSIISVSLLVCYLVFNKFVSILGSVNWCSDGKKVKSGVTYRSCWLHGSSRNPRHHHSCHHRWHHACHLIKEAPWNIHLWVQAEALRHSVRPVFDGVVWICFGEEVRLKL